MKAETKKPLVIRQPLIPTASLKPAVRITLAVLSILAGVYFAIGFVVMGLALFALLFYAINIAMNNFALIFAVTVTYLAPPVIYLILCILNVIFAKCLFRKQLLAQKLLVTYIVLIVLGIVLQQTRTLFFSLIATGLGG